MSGKFIFGIGCLSALGVFLFALGSAMAVDNPVMSLIGSIMAGDNPNMMLIGSAMAYLLVHRPSSDDL